MRHDPSHRLNHYGTFAFASVILTCFMQFAFMRNIPGQPWQVLVTFGLGAVYTALVLLDDHCVHRFGQRWRTPVFLLECIVVTVLIYVSPARGFFGIILLPLVSQAIFDYSWRWALAISLYFYAASVGVFAFYYGRGSVSEASLSYLAAFAFTCVFTAMTKQAFIAKEKAEQLTQDLEEANRQLREHADQTEEFATTRERNRLAREIHDGVGHYLTVVKTQLDAAAILIGTRPDEARETVVKAAKLTGDALDDVRRSVGALRTDTARPPLPEALRALTVESGLPVTVRLEGTARPLSPGIEHALFRSAQEGLTNIRKHAAAPAAEVRLDFRSPGSVTLAVIDNGRGTSGAPGAGFGLRGIAERIEVLGGRVESGNRPAGGFALTIEVPA